MQYVYCAVGTEALHIIQVNISLEGVNSIQKQTRTKSHAVFLSLSLRDASNLSAPSRILRDGEATETFKQTRRGTVERKVLSNVEFVTAELVLYTELLCMECCLTELGG
jgi:hypothetical protein